MREFFFRNLTLKFSNLVPENKGLETAEHFNYLLKLTICAKRTKIFNILSWKLGKKNPEMEKWGEKL